MSNLLVFTFTKISNFLDESFWPCTSPIRPVVFLQINHQSVVCFFFKLIVLNKFTWVVFLSSTPTKLHKWVSVGIKVNDQFSFLSCLKLVCASLALNGWELDALVLPKCFIFCKDPYSSECWLFVFVVGLLGFLWVLWFLQFCSLGGLYFLLIVWTYSLNWS